MPSKRFPDSGSRQIIRDDGDWAASGQITYYLDTEGTLAPVYAERGTDTPDPSDALAGSSTHLDAYGRQVDFRGPSDGRRMLWYKVDNGPLCQTFAAPEDDLDDLDERVTVEATARTQADAANLSTAVGAAAGLAIVFGA